MSIEQKMHFESGLLNVDASGEFSLEEAKRAFLEMLAAVARYQAEKILLDGRKVKGKPEDLQRFYYGEFAARETLRLVSEHKIVPRFAYVMHQPLRDPRGLGETVAVNRGMNVKTFETLEDALEWLDFNKRMQAKVEERNRCQPVRICAWGSGLFLRAPARHANQFALMLLWHKG